MPKRATLLLLAAQRSFILCGDLAAEPIEASTLFAGNGSRRRSSAMLTSSSQIGGHVRLDATTGSLLSDVLPPWIQVRSSSPQATVLRWLLDQLIRERAADLPGAALVSAQLAQLIFVQILRAHLETSAPLASGWLRALGDPRIAPALRLMHSEPGRAWHLENLAKAAAMSRTTFALHFKTVTGVTPLTYLTEWRMRLADRALREENVPVAVLGSLSAIHPKAHSATPSNELLAAHRSATGPLRARTVGS